MKLLNSTLILLLCTQVFAQDPGRFSDQVNRISSSTDSAFDIVITGSSSIRRWTNVSREFNHVRIKNTGFGGSEMSDLLFYHEELILKFKPEKVIIYEGDNDLSNGEDIDTILAEAEKLVRKLQSQLPELSIYFISPKPSISRWKLKDSYIRLNEKLRTWCDEEPNVGFIDVWTPMLDQNGEVLKDIFTEDDLHMNEKGYMIWKKR